MDVLTSLFTIRTKPMQSEIMSIHLKTLRGKFGKTAGNWTFVQIKGSAAGPTKKVMMVNHFLGKYFPADFAIREWNCSHKILFFQSLNGAIHGCYAQRGEFLLAMEKNLLDSQWAFRLAKESQNTFLLTSIANTNHGLILRRFSARMCS